MNTDIRPFSDHQALEEEDSPGILRRVIRWLSRLSLHLFVGLLVVAMIVFALAGRITKTLHSGELGVMYYRFGNGTDKETVYGEGTHFMLPWNEMIAYDVRIQNAEDSIAALSRDGLYVTVHYSVHYRPSRKSLGKMHQAVGPDYLHRIVIPEASSAVRHVISDYTPQEIYFEDHDVIQAQVLKRMRAEGRETFVDFVDIMIRDIQIPERIESAIQGKLEYEQRSLEYSFKLSAETQEAERKRIEAKGIADFEKISGISILKWRGLEATEKLAASPNSKVVVIGKESDELPVILGGDK
jgi:prohibitin 1